MILLNHVKFGSHRGHPFRCFGSCIVFLYVHEVYKQTNKIYYEIRY